LNAPARPPALDAELEGGAHELGLRLPAERRRLLLDYLALLAKWNATYNLTAIRDPARMLSHHLLDSLSVVPFVRGPRLLDVGSGAGLPGVVLAIVLPDLHCVLLDANSKKTRFLVQAAIELRLANVEVVCARAGDYRPEEGFATVVSRAVGALEELLVMTRHLGAPGGRLLAMKGAVPASELKMLERRGLPALVHPLKVPGVQGERHLVEVRFESLADTASR